MVLRANPSLTHFGGVVNSYFAFFGEIWTITRHSSRPRDSLAEQFGKTTRSVIAKLSREGVYQAQPRTTKSGETVISKSELVAMISELLSIEVPTLVKAGKQDLQKLVDAIQS
jgi:hypothetical protein